jgi:3',5'-cyclic AMP phosphodiesterase CpdA
LSGNSQLATITSFAFPIQFMKLYAISDLHVNRAINWHALMALPAHPGDWLIVAGDVSEKIRQFRAAMAFLAGRFECVFWTPGNHDLWTLPSDSIGLRGLAKYEHLVAICRELGVLTPEDPYVRWPEDGSIIAPTFTLYDYSFRPAHVPQQTAVAWAMESGTLSTDEALLHPAPFPSIAAWCTIRCRETETRLQRAAVQGSLILVNHYPLRYDLVNLKRIPRFSLWCGSKRTEAWHTRFPVTAVVYGHLHIRGTYERDGVRFEEVSLGYPENWQSERGIRPYLRQIR